jgi:ceramide glucosyltransferase
VDNVLGHLPLRAFLARHLRWARIRRRMNLAGYVGEMLLNPVFLAATAALAVQSRASFALAVAVLAVKSSLDAAAERAAGVRRPLVLYPVLTLVKDLVIGAVWVVPFASSTVAWRGNRFRIGPRTVLSRDGAEPEVLALDPASAEAAS